MNNTELKAGETYHQAVLMKAIAMTDFPEIGTVADQLRMIETPIPRPKSNEVAIELKASSMHIDEIYAAQGTSLGRFFGPKEVSIAKPYIMGSSVSGTIIDLGENVTQFALYDDVIVIPNETGEIGSWAKYRCVTENMVLHKPASINHVQAAALTMASCVAWGAVEFGIVQRGERCLVVGASGAIGILTVQFLKSLGAHVTGICSEQNADLVMSKGADEIIDYTEQNFGDLPPGSFDKVFDTIGGRKTENDAYKVLNRTGRFVTIVGPVQHIGERKLSWSEFICTVGYIILRYCTSFLSGPRYLFGEKLPRHTIRNAMKHIVEHDITMPIEQEIVFEIHEIKDAVRLLTSHRTKGRLVINFQKQASETSTLAD